MIIQTHDGLEVGLYIISGIGAIGAFVFNLVRGNLEEKIIDNKKTMETQWQRIDEIKSNYVKRDQHDATVKEIYEAIERAVERGTKPLLDSFNRLSDQITRIIEAQKK